MDKRVFRCNHLLKRMQRGSEKALDDLYHEYGPLFLRMAQFYLIDPDRAEDVVSELFVELVKTTARTFDPTRNSLNWIHTIIRRLAARYNAVAYHEQPLDEHMAETLVACLDDQDERASDVALLRKALSDLTPEENRILYLKYWEGLTIREIAQKLDKPRSTVQYKMEGALTKLRKSFQQGEKEHERL